MREISALPPDERQRRHESLQAAPDLIDQGFTLIDGDLRMVAWNKAVLRLLNLPESMGCAGAPFESFMRDNAKRGVCGTGDARTYTDERVQAARAFAPQAYERTRPDGTVLRVRGLRVPGHGFVMRYADITRQTAAERQTRDQNALLETRVAERTAELLRSEAQMRLITDDIPALVAYFDHDWVYRCIYRGHHEWFGLDTAQPGAISAKQYLGAANRARRCHRHRCGRRRQRHGRGHPGASVRAVFHHQAARTGCPPAVRPSRTATGLAWPKPVPIRAVPPRAWPCWPMMNLLCAKPCAGCCCTWALR